MNIIAVDDERIALTGLHSILRAILPEAEIACFRNAEEALRHAKQQAVDIAFLDVRMREMSGVEMAKQLKDLHPRANIIFVTGYDEYAKDAIGMHASGFILKPVTREDVERELRDLRYPLAPRQNALLRVQCFGNFDVFTPAGEPVRFARSKAKETFAYLIHKHGSGSTTREIAAVLFEDAPFDTKHQVYFQQIISSMMQTLRQENAEGVVIKSYRTLAVDISKVDCDYYRFAQMDAAAVNAYASEYMAQYSWAEFVAAHLERMR